MPEPPRRAAWLEPWIEDRNRVAILGAALVVLTLILGFQSALSRSRRAHRWVRNGFLLFTLVWLGWIASAQLSIVNPINYLKAPFAGFGADFYLAEPLVVMIAAYTAVSLLLLGRGVFCGWQCPFGALHQVFDGHRLLRLRRQPRQCSQVQFADPIGRNSPQILRRARLQAQAKGIHAHLLLCIYI